MSIDTDNIAPAIDPETVNLAADRGDSIPEPKAVEPEPEPKVVEPEAEEPEAEEPEAEEAEEPPRDEKGKFASKGIPKARFDEAVGKEREAREAAERRAADLERQLGQRQQQQVQSAQIDEIENQIAVLEKQYADLTLDGEAEKAAAVMKQIRHTEREITYIKAEAAATQRTNQVMEAERVEATIARLEADIPEMNPDSESYDADLVELVLSKQRSLIQQGTSASKALDVAARTVAERFLKKIEPVETKGLAASKGDGRKAEQVAKNLDAQKRQPASMKDAGLDSDKAGFTGTIDVTKLTPDEFAALPKATIARLRGDVA